MGDPRKTKRHYTNPRKRWDKARIDVERGIINTYGLKNKREIRMLEALLRRKRHSARTLLAMSAEKRGNRGEELLKSLARLSILNGKSVLDDILGLSLTQLMERRLQTVVWRKNLAKTPVQARQFITHGHIAVNSRKVTCPGYLVDSDMESKIAYFKKPMQLEPKKVAVKTAAPAKGTVAEGATAIAEAAGETAAEKEAI